MNAFGSKTRASIKAYLEIFIENLVSKYRERIIPTLGAPKAYLAKKSSKGQLKPFHAAIIPHELLRINEFERGFSTRLGTTFEECARLIALEHHRDAQRNYDLRGQVSLVAINEIEHQVSAYERAAANKGLRPALRQMIHDVLALRKRGDLVERSARADLYILGRNGTEFFFEMKSPQPNKGQCLEVMQRILRVHLLRGRVRPKIQAYFAMAYNPFGPKRTDYHWSFAREYMPFDEAVVIGHEFWKIVGGSGAYQQLLEVYQEVGREKSKYILDALAFGF
jgi:hypothetical protein